jgi:hypothetical protein
MPDCTDPCPYGSGMPCVTPGGVVSGGVVSGGVVSQTN